MTRARCPPFRFQSSGSLRLPGPDLRRQFAFSITTNRQGTGCQTGACTLGQSFSKASPSPSPGAAFGPAPRGLRSDLRTTTSCGPASPGRPGYGLCFHEVVEKVGVTAFRKVYIMNFIGSSRDFCFYCPIQSKASSRFTPLGLLFSSIDIPAGILRVRHESGKLRQGLFPVLLESSPPRSFRGTTVKDRIPVSALLQLEADQVFADRDDLGCRVRQSLVNGRA